MIHGEGDPSRFEGNPAIPPGIPFGLGVFDYFDDEVKAGAHVLPKECIQQTNEVDKLNADGLDCGNLGLRRCQRGSASDQPDPCALTTRDHGPYEEAQVVFEETAGSADEWANGDVPFSCRRRARCINPSDFTTKDDFVVSCTGNPEQASLLGLGCVRSFATYTNYDAASGIAVFTGTGWKKFDAPAEWLCAE